MLKKPISKFLIFGLVLLFLLVFVVLVIVSRGNHVPPTTTSSTPTPTPISETNVTQPISKWASDDVFVNLEKNIAQTESDLEQVTRLKDVELVPPELDLNVRF